LFIMEGSVGIGYRLFDEIFYGKKITVANNMKMISMR